MSYVPCRLAHGIIYNTSVQLPTPEDSCGCPELSFPTPLAPCTESVNRLQSWALNYTLLFLPNGSKKVGCEKHVVIVSRAGAKGGKCFRGRGELHMCTHTYTQRALFLDQKSLLLKTMSTLNHSPACLGILGLPWGLEPQELLANLDFPCHLSAH